MRANSKPEGVQSSASLANLKVSLRYPEVMMPHHLGRTLPVRRQGPFTQLLGYSQAGSDHDLSVAVHLPCMVPQVDKYFWNLRELTALGNTEPHVPIFHAAHRLIE
jgi:hypothetical protein